jgi:hypothetical protein
LNPRKQRRWPERKNRLRLPSLSLLSLGGKQNLQRQRKLNLLKQRQWPRRNRQQLPSRFLLSPGRRQSLQWQNPQQLRPKLRVNLKLRNQLPVMKQLLLSLSLSRKLMQR